MTVDDLEFERDGAIRFGGVLSGHDVASLAEKLEPQIKGRPGKRLRLDSDLVGLLSSKGAAGRIATALIGADAHPVRAVVFDKSPEANWLVAWHQDRTICVRERHEMAGFGPWSAKDGILRVAPPMSVLAGMTTLRIHLDPVKADNAPLLVATGSHKFGCVPADEASDRARTCRSLVCEAAAGDVWAYATPILHMSARSSARRRRRVLQVDYAATPLPSPLEWLGIEA